MYIMPIHHGELHRLTSVWSGLPPCSVVIFRHLQKTGGTSVVRLFEDLQRDLQWSVSGYWTPCWRGRSQHLAQGRLRWLRGLRMLAEDAIKANGHYANSSASFIGSSSSRFLDTPPWAARQLFHVHHPDAVECGGLPAAARAEQAATHCACVAVPCRRRDGRPRPVAIFRLVVVLRWRSPVRPLRVPRIPFAQSECAESHGDRGGAPVQRGAAQAPPLP